MHLHRRFEPVAAADGRDLQVERSVAWMAALLDQVVGGLALRADLHELLVVVVVLPEVAAQAALSVVNGHQHGLLLSAPEERTKQSACRGSQIPCETGSRRAYGIG